MEEVYEKFVTNHRMPRGANLCYWLGDSGLDKTRYRVIGLVAVDFRPEKNNKPWFIIVKPSQGSKFGDRNGMIKYDVYKTLAGLVNDTGPSIADVEMDYWDFMNKYIRTGHYFCSNILLDI